MLTIKTIIINGKEQIIQYDDKIVTELKEIHGLDFMEEVKKLMEKKMIKLIHGDCLPEMDRLIEQGIVFDVIITDPPYGTTACKWDSIIPFNRHIILTKSDPFPTKKLKQKIMYEEEFILHCYKQGMSYENAKILFDKESIEGMWDKIKKLIKPNGAIVLFGSQPFTSALIMSNPKMFKYEWVWGKSKATGHLDAKRKPMRNHENIIVFGDKGFPSYYPQGLKDGVFKTGRNVDMTGKVYSQYKNHGTSTKGNYPKTIVKISNPSGKGHLHPTQKPVALMEYLIKTYTNENETVLDFTMGSGSTLVAAKNLNRGAYGIEKDEKYFEIAKNRIENT